MKIRVTGCREVLCREIRYFVPAALEAIDRPLDEHVVVHLPGEPAGTEVMLAIALAIAAPLEVDLSDFYACGSLEHRGGPRWCSRYRYCQVA